MRVLVTGVAGFIGSTLALRLLARGDSVVGIDSMNDYYQVSLKEDRLARVAAVVLIVNQVIAALVHWQQRESSALPQNVVLVAMLLVPALFLKNTQEKNG